jgi:hypothetical protein
VNIRSVAPKLGADTADLLQELGFAAKGDG